MSVQRLFNVVQWLFEEQRMWRGFVGLTKSKDTILGWYRKLVAEKFDGSRQLRLPGRPPIDSEIESLVVRLARENSGWATTVSLERWPNRATR